MNLTNINKDKMKQSNIQYVLHTIRRNEPISRKELSDLVNMTPSSITNIVNRLLKENFLRESGSGESLAGRKPILLELNSTARYAVGVELNTENIICIITNFKAEKMVKKECETVVTDSKESVLNRLVNLIKAAIIEAKIAKEEIMGVGLVSAGPYNHTKGLMINPPNFPGWFNVPIRDIVQTATGIPTYFEKETVGAAIGEFWFGEASSARSLFAINIYNVGIGGGVIIDGKVYHGFKDGAGDIGHMVVDIEGPACSCGNYGCLEAMASGMAIVRDVKSELKRGEKSLLLESVDNIDDIDLDMIIEASKKGDLLVNRVIEKCARYMGIAMANLINVYSPQMIVLGGKITKECPDYLEIAIEYAKKRKYPLYNKDVVIIPSTFGEEQGAMGGVGLVFQEFFKNVDID
jgi:N-acetylglucosamine repressor